MISLGMKWGRSRCFIGVLLYISKGITEHSQSDVKVKRISGDVLEGSFMSLGRIGERIRA